MQAQPSYQPFVRNTVDKVVSISIASLFATLLLMHFYLVRVGMWHGDEYGLLPHYQDGNFTFYIHRVLGWSPRPVSEIFVWAYAYSSGFSHASNITYALTISWLILFVTLDVALILARVEVKLRYLVSFSAFTFCLLINNPGEVFYWPIGAAAYVPTIAGIAAICFVSALRTTPNNLVCDYAMIVMLIIVAGSSEIGAMFCLAYCTFRGLSSAFEYIRHNVRLRHDQLALFIPALMSVSVFVIVLRGRVAINSEAGGAGHQLLASLLQGAYVVGDEIMSRDATFAPRLLVVLMFCAGLALVLTARAEPTKPKHVGALLGALLATIYGSAASAQYQFGYNCCERQSFTRTSLMVLVALPIAIYVTMRLAHQLRNLPLSVLGGVLILTSAGLPLIVRLPQLIEEYRKVPSRIRILEKNQSAGLSPQNEMQFLIGDESKIVDTGGFKIEGTFMSKPQTPWQPENIMRFYRKDKIQVITGE